MVEGSAGGGMVVAVANGRQQLVEVRIEPEVVDRAEVEMLQDLVVAAVNQALAAMTADAVFSIASMTKPMTSVAIMQLFERGHVEFLDIGEMRNFLLGCLHALGNDAGVKAAGVRVTGQALVGQDRHAITRQWFSVPLASATWTEQLQQLQQWSVQIFFG